MNTITTPILLRKTVNWSMLTSGIPIPIEQQKIYSSIVGFPLAVGARHDVKIIIDDELFDAHFENVAFNRDRFTHPDLIRLMYDIKLKRKLQAIFADTYSKMLSQKANIAPRQRMPELEDSNNYVVISATTDPNVFSLDYFTESDEQQIHNSLQGIGEQVYENELIPMFDKNAGYSVSEAVRKIRRLDRSIGESLKQLYDNRCQMTGEKVGEEQGACCVEAHHIVPFVESLNNDYSNIIILSPNYHRIIHKANPIFDKVTLSFKFPNGRVDKVKINKHLNF